MLPLSGSGQEAEDIPVTSRVIGVGAVVAAEPAALRAKAPAPAIAAAATAAAMRRNLILVEPLPPARLARPDIQRVPAS
jgi:hypothetical protein